MIDLVCTKCGSHNIEFTAYGVWSTHEQDYQLEVAEAYCDDCGVVEVKEIEI